MVAGVWEDPLLRFKDGSWLGDRELCEQQTLHCNLRSDASEIGQPLELQQPPQLVVGLRLFLCFCRWLVSQ
jgi:hypothetical protein